MMVGEVVTGQDSSRNKLIVDSYTVQCKATERGPEMWINLLDKSLLMELLNSAANPKDPSIDT